MSRLIFAAALWLTLPLSLHGQLTAVPGRDLLEFPIGAMAEAQALASQLGAGLWNPATTPLRPADRAQIGIAAMNSPIDQGISGGALVASAALPRGFTASASLTRMAVVDLLHTETDPQSIGGEIPYSTTVYSLGAAYSRNNSSIGVAARYRTGTLDLQHGSATSVDAGFVIDHFLRTPLRLAASTFLFAPERRAAEPATYLTAADLPVFRRDTTWEWRAGYAMSNTEGHGHDNYVFASGRYRQLDARGGVAESVQFGNTTRRLRLGLALHYARYSVGIAREENGAGLSATYQFALTSVFR